MMAHTNTKESGLETLIVDWLVSQNGFEQGTNSDYNREFAIDEERLFRFLGATQREEMDKLGVFESELNRTKFLNRLSGEIAKRGIIDVLRNGMKCYPADLILFYMAPREGNPKSKDDFDQNIFSVTRQLQYSNDSTRLALDLALFINGLPIITGELKNQLTKQCVEDAVLQYQKDRNPRERLFEFKRCMVHFAIDDARVKFCTKLEGKSSWFLPFDKGFQDGTGNPPNPNGLMTEYLWKQIFTKHELANIIENYAQTIEETESETGKKRYKQIFPRYHQLDVVKRLLADVQKNGVGKRYLIQHSAGSGKSNSIAWLAHQLIGLENKVKPIIDTVIVVTDRVILDRQIRDTIKQFMQVQSTVVWAEHSDDLRRAIEGGKKIVITTVHKFPYILDSIGNEHKGRSFALIIDEAHSSQSGSMSAKMNMALAGESAEVESVEDKINQLIEGRKMLKNACYFAFTATPKNKTLELFGEQYHDGAEVKRRPFHAYTMKQAIQEGFILDVLAFYTPIESFYRLAKTIEDDPYFDKKRAQKKLRYFVESNRHAIAQKAEIMVNHFHDQVIAKGKIGGKARAMVVTGSIERCLEYFHAIKKSLENRNSRWRPIIAFSGEKEYGGKVLTSAALNGFPDGQIEKTFRNDPYRFLVVADMFQTGYDEPLLHTMYVDKLLSDIKAVQTLSRLNRSHPHKHDTFVLDFANDVTTIEQAFSRYYRTTILSSETDPNKLYDLIADMEGYQVYSQQEVELLVKLYLDGADRDRLDPILDVATALYLQLDDTDQIKFKGAVKAFVRTYGFLGAILPYGNPAWERLSIYLHLLLPKLPAPQDDDLSQGILDAIDLDSYRVEARETMAVILQDAEAEIEPIPTGKASGKAETQLDTLSAILTTFNDLFGNIPWNDADHVRKQISEIPAMVLKDEHYQNAIKNSDRQNARLESERALQNVILGIMSDNMELFKQFNDNPSFKKWLSDLVFNVTYNTNREPFPTGSSGV